MPSNAACGFNVTTPVTLPPPVPAPFSFAQIQAVKDETAALIKHRHASDLKQLADKAASAKAQADNTHAAMSLPPAGSNPSQAPHQGIANGVFIFPLLAVLVFLLFISKKKKI